MERRALGRGDHIGGGARTRGLGNFDFASGCERGRDALERRQRLGQRAFAEIAAGDRDLQAIGAVIDARQRGSAGRVDADRIVRIVTLHGVVSEREVADRARERPEVIEACDEGKRACPRQTAIGRLQPENAAERGGHADRAVGVGAERERNQPAGDRAAGAAGGAAGHAQRIVRIARWTVVHILAGEVVGVFAHVERADQNGAGRLQPLDQRGVARGRRMLAIDLRAGQRRQAGNVEQVLDRERNARQRAEVCRLARAAHRLPPPWRGHAPPSPR